MLVLLEAKIQLFYSRYTAGLAVCSRSVQFLAMSYRLVTAMKICTAFPFVAPAYCLYEQEFSNYLLGWVNGQASHITGGIYMKPPQPDGLFEYLMVHDASYPTSENCVNDLFRLSLTFVKLVLFGIWLFYFLLHMLVRLHIFSRPYQFSDHVDLGSLC